MTDPTPNPTSTPTDYKLAKRTDSDTVATPNPTNDTTLPKIPRQDCFRHIRHRKQRKFLEGLVFTGGNVARAAALAGISQSLPYTIQWRAEPFASAFLEARRMAAAALEGEAIRRAFEGIETPVGWHKGLPGAFVRTYSDVLLIFLLKGAYPEKYADRMELKGALAQIDLKLLPDDALQRIANGEHPNAVIAGLAQDALARGVLALPPGQDAIGDGSRDTIEDTPEG